MEKVSLEVGGMNCTACAVSVEKKIREAGASDVFVSFTTGEASFLKPGDISLELIVRDIESLGYTVADDRKSGGLSTEVRDLRLLLVSGLLTIPLLLHMFVHWPLLMNPLFQFGLSFPVLVIGLFRFGRSAWSSTLSMAPNMDVLIMTGALASFVYSLLSWLWFVESAGPVLYFETSASIITLVLLGNFLEHRTVKETTTALRELVALKPSKAKRISLQLGQEVNTEVDVREIAPGDLIAVVSGERIAADGVVVRGSGLCDESAISGESVPVELTEGSSVYGGTYLEQGSLLIRVDKSGNATLLHTIIEQVKQAQREKPSIQKLGDRVSHVFVPLVMVISLLTFLVSFFFLDIGTGQSLMSAIAVLVISCPCALGLATPTAVMAGIGRATRAGILIRGGQTLEVLSEVKIVVFDKTGTLTDGRFNIHEIIQLAEISLEEIKAIVGRLEKHSAHPFARSVAGWEHFPCSISFVEIEELKGYGLRAKDSAGHQWMLGSHRSAEGLDLTAYSTCDLFLSRDNQLIAAMRISDQLRPEGLDVVQSLLKEGMRVVMISGDRANRCAEVAAKLGIKEFYAEKLPVEKTKLLQEFKKNGKVAMVGDGINDAPALAISDVGISLSGATDIAIKTAQVVLMQQGNLKLLGSLFRISGATMKTIRQNLFFSFFYNVLAIPVAAAGFLSPVIGAFAMAMSDVVVVGNSIRLKFRSLD